tara:strand:+ start:1408 stop:1704 length:297 start_codon:yes stop_codon:yes gene_type:complete
MIYIVDIDGTICNTKDGKYAESKPMFDRIEKINKLYDEGHTIKYMTARGAVTKMDWRELTETQLKEWGCKYHELDVGNKPHFDLWIDDKAINSEEFFK